MLTDEMRAVADRWAKRFVPRPAARTRLFVFPFAGSGAATMRRFAVAFPPEIEVLPIEYPGRWTRAEEPFAPSVEALADGADAALGPLLDRPYAVLGCSLGALVGYEWLRRLADRGAPSPRAFYACARKPPGPSDDLALADLPDVELVAAMEARYGAVPGPRIEADLLPLLVPPLRADLHALRRYRPVAGTPLPYPVRAWGGAADPSVSRADLDAWRGHTTADFASRTFPGGHFFVLTAGGELRDAIIADLAAAATWS